MIKKILLVSLLLGGLFYIWSDNQNKDTLNNSYQPAQTEYLQSLKLPGDNDLKQTTSSQKPKDINNSDNSRNYTYFFLPPAPINTNLTAGNVPQEIYLNNTHESTVLNALTGQNFESWRDAVAAQGYDLNDIETLNKLKSVRLEFNTLAEIAEQSNESLNQLIENIKQNSNLTIELSDDMLLGDVLEESFDININVDGISPQLKQIYIESFYDIPITIERGMEIADFIQSEFTITPDVISEVIEQEIQNYLEGEAYAQLEQNLNQIINPAQSIENLFDTVGSSITPVTSAGLGYPPLGGQCGGNTLMPPYPPGYTAFAPLCSTCPKCLVPSCECICGCYVVGFIWDSITGICGCGA